MATGSTVKPGMLASDDIAIVSAIATVRGRLRSMHSLGGKKWSESKGWAKLRAAVFLFGIPFMTREAQLQRKRRDAQATAVARWQQLELFRAFRSWRSKAAAMTAAAAGAGAGSTSASAAAATVAAPATKTTAALVGTKRSRSRADGDGDATPSASASASSLPPSQPQPLLSSIPDSAEPFFPAPKTAFEMKARRGHTGLRNLGEFDAQLLIAGGCCACYPAAAHALRVSLACYSSTLSVSSAPLPLCDPPLQATRAS